MSFDQGIRILLAAAALASGAFAQDKAAAPSPSDQAEVEKMIKDVFKDDYSKRAIADRQALAKSLLTQGIKSKSDLKYQFVLLREAKDIAGASGDPATGLAAVDEMAKVFEVDSTALKIGVLAQAAKVGKTADDFRTLVRLSFKQIEAALAADDYDGAEKYVPTALQVAKRTQDLALVNRAAAKGKEIADLKARFEKLRKARETLATDPLDGASNHLLGIFLCVVKGEWDQGLPLLAKSPDPVYGPLALKELSSPQDPTAQVGIADAWWDLSERESGPSKDRLKERAGLWYSRALPGLSGLSKTKVERRIVDGRIARVLRGSWMDVTEGRLFNVPGKPGDPIEVPGKPNSITTLRMQFPKGDFDGLSARIIFDPSKSSVAFVIYEGPAAFATCIDTERGFFANMRGAPGGWNLDYTDFWTKEAETVVTVLLTEGDYVLYVNGIEKTKLKAKNNRIEFLGLEARNATVKFDQIKLRRAE
ncbi:MAG TPA: hypothetical protein VKW04_20400 [Planctomycetota bacterium]|nr:hypothetical protein [Planctomycetota bacterium]